MTVIYVSIIRNLFHLSDDHWAICEVYMSVHRLHNTDTVLLLSIMPLSCILYKIVAYNNAICL